MPPDIVRQLREIRKDDYVEDETAVSGTELNILELTVTFLVCPHCQSTRLRLIRGIPQQKNEMNKQ